MPSSTRSRSARKLAVIVHTDVVGSTTLVRLDETLADERIQDAFERFSGEIFRYHGTAHELRGDALVAEFARASDAIAASLAFQAANTSHNEKLPDAIRPAVRIGIAMGEVVVGENRMTGEGVVLAQRLEQLAEPGGVVVQGSVVETVPGRLPFVYESLGEQALKGIERAVRAYRVTLKAGAEVPDWGAGTGGEPSTTRPGYGLAGLREERLGGIAEAPSEALPLPSKPSVAVLPFTNMSGDAEQEYFSDGITEDIITELSRHHGLFVIARNSSFAFKGGAVDIAEVGRKLGVRYVVEGSVRKAGKRIRITAQLVEAASGNHVWAERYDRDLEDIFAVQDEVTERIVWALAGRVEMAEIARSRRRPMENLDAYDLMLRGAELLHRYSREKVAEALPLFEKAVELEPASAVALAWLARAYAGASVREGDVTKRELALQAAERALAEGDPDGQAEATIAGIAGLRHDLDGAEVHVDRALARGPNNPYNLVIKAYLLLWQGRAAEAREMGERLWRLDPFDRLVVHELLAYAHYLLGNYQTSLDAFRKWGLSEYRGYANLAACLAQLGRIEEARAAWRRCLELKPGFNLEDYKRDSPYRRPEDLEHWLEGVRKAGVAE